MLCLFVLFCLSVFLALQYFWRLQSSFFCKNVFQFGFFFIIRFKLFTYGRNIILMFILIIWLTNVWNISSVWSVTFLLCIYSKYFVGRYFKTRCTSHFSLNFQFIHLLISAWAQGLSFHLISLFNLMFKLFHIWLVGPSSSWLLCSFDMSLLDFGYFRQTRYSKVTFSFPAWALE